MGDFIGATRASRNLIVTVAGKEFSETTLLAEYTNAFEAVMQASFDLLNSMRNSNEILFNVGANRPIYVFPLVGAARAIELARFNCK